MQIYVFVGNILDDMQLEAWVILVRRRYKIFYEVENTLIITVINGSNENVRNGSGKIITNKGDSENHGIGLESVRKVTKKYHSLVVIEPGTQKILVIK